MPVHRLCANCGAELQIPPSRAASCQNSYCDRACMLEHRERTDFYRGKNNPSWQGGLIALECAFCGEEFLVKHSHVEKRQCCSRKCRAALQSTNALGYDPEKRIKKACTVCGAIILVKQSHADIEGTYCSRECMAQDYQDTLTGDNNPNYKDGQSNTPEYYRAHGKKWRAAHPERVRYWNRITRAKRKEAEGTHSQKDIEYHWRQQGGECIYCSVSLEESYHVDHIIPLVRGGTNYVGNLQLLCPTCNMRKKAMLPVEFRRYLRNNG